LSRSLGSPSTGAPWYNKWTVPSLNLADVGPSSPVEVTSLIGTNTMLTCTFGADTSFANPEWHLTVEDTLLQSVPPMDADRSVIAVISAVTATTPTQRSTQRNNQFTGDDFDVRVHVPVQFDLRSLHKSTSYKYYIALASQGGATDCYLLDILATNVAL
jgi:hypothetical protein